MQLHDEMDIDYAKCVNHVNLTENNTKLSFMIDLTFTR
jgi:hypothetical protein